MASGKDRIGFIATARCVGILLVVFGHSFPFDVSIPRMLTKVIEFIYTFHMPLFIFISGYLLTLNTRSAGTYIHRRGLRLLIPYLALSAVAFVPKMLVQQYLNDSVEFSLWYLIRSELIPRDNIWGHFWYIPVVFFLSCFGVVIRKPMRKHQGVSWAVLAASYIILFFPHTTDWLALEDLRKTAFYFILGMVTADRDPTYRVVSNRCWMLAFPAAIVLFAAVDTTLTDSIIACLMIGFVLYIGTGFSLEGKRMLAAIEKNSFSIFLLSWPAQAVAEVICNKVLHLPVALTMGTMFLAGILVPLICIKIVSSLDKRFPMKWVKLIIGM